MDASWATHVGFVVLALAVVIQVISGVLGIRKNSKKSIPPRQLPSTAESVESAAAHEIYDARLASLERRMSAVEVKCVTHIRKV